MSEKPARNGKRAPIPVRCVDTGETFESADRAAELTGISRGAISSAMRTGKPVKGLRFEKAPGHAGPFIADARCLAARSARDGRGRHAAPVRCAETGDVFENAASAARAIGASPSALSAAVCKGTACRGLHFERCAAPARGDYAAGPDCATAREAAKAPERKAGPVVCAETGEAYRSMANAARHLGVNECTLRAATAAGRACKGLHFRRDPDYRGPLVPDAPNAFDRAVELFARDAELRAHGEDGIAQETARAVVAHDALSAGIQPASNALRTPALALGGAGAGRTLAAKRAIIERELGARADGTESDG